MISVVVLTHNSELTIERTLASVAWSDEVVVIDDMSTDSTADRARKYNAVVYPRALKHDFAAQRNFGLSKAKYPWILFVDSDEVVSEELAQEIRSETRNSKFETRNIEGYYIKRVDWMWGRELKHGETAYVLLLRLAKKGNGLWREPVHEVWDVSGKTALLHYPLLHYPHPDVAQFLQHIHIYSTLRAKYLFDAKTPVHGWHIAAYPVAKFLKNYIVLRGFLDGMPGLIVALMMSFHSFLVRSKLYLLYYKKTVPFDELL